MFTLNRSVFCVVLLLALGLVVGTIATPARSQSGALDPQSLVGQWSGEWVGGANQKANGRYYLTIEKVEGNKVSGKGQVLGRRTTEFTIGGTLDGNRLSYGKTVLTVDGDRMNGQDGGNLSAHISLTKGK